MRLESGEARVPPPGTPLTRRELLLAVVAAAAARPVPLGAARSLDTGPVQSVLPFRVLTLNHISFGCDDLASTVGWFERVLGIPRHAFQDYLGGGLGQTVLRASIDPPAYMALSQRPREAIGAPRTGRPHFCWGIADFDVHRILAGLAEMRIPAESVLREGTTINGVNFDGPDGEPFQFNPVIACGGLGLLGEICEASARAVRRQGDPPPVQVVSMNHVKYHHADVDRALEWYLKLTDMRVVTHQEREGGPRTEGYEGRPLPVLRIGAGPQHLVLAEGSGPEASRMHVGFGVADFDPRRVMGLLAEHGVTAEVRMREGVTPEVLVDGPDGVRIQLQDVRYCGGSGVLGDVCSAP